MHNQCIGSFYRQKRQQHGHRPILRISINRVSTIFSFESCVMYVPIGCRHPFMRHWQPLKAKTTATCSLLHPENERQRRMNSFRSFIFRNHGITWIFAHITESLTTLIGRDKLYQRWKTDSQSIEIANCKTSEDVLLVVDNLILIRYYYHTAKTRGLYESIDGPAGRPADNLPNSDGFRVYHRMVSDLIVQFHWRPRRPVWQWFSWDPDLDLKWQSGTVSIINLGA